ncbi:MAG: tetratricopeptide repeat protein [Candidatus Omnitrophica bacterium]|nr:tetratricopeptide repeat protein [Candidatus Omnitrophota bacterium]
MKKKVQKSILGLILFGIALAIVFVEICLNLFNPIASSPNQRNQAANSENTENVCKIICLGDSFTYGLGASRENSYPAQMEKILNQSRQNKIFLVKNLGIPGETLSQTLIKLDKAVKEFQPDIVIILSGINDTWSLPRYCKFRFSKSIQELNPFSLNLKFFKLIDLIAYNLKTPIAPGSDIPSIIKTANQLRDAKKYNQAQAYYEQALMINPQDPIALLELGRCQKLTKDYQAAGLTLEKAFVQNPESKIIHRELTDLFIKHKNIPEEFSLLLRLKNRFPDNMYLIQRLCYVYSILGEPFFSSNLAKKIANSQTKTLDINSLSKSELDLLESYYVQSKAAYNPKNKPQSFWKNFSKKISERIINISELRYLNYEKAAKLCEQEKIDLIFSSYPSILLEDMKTVAEKYNIPLVDNSLTFYDLLQEHSPREFFVSEFDRHCTASGYEVIARNVAAAVLRIVNSD